MPQDLEEWKPVVGFEGFYEVSSQGRIRRVVGGQGTKGIRILNPSLMQIGYLQTSLSKGAGAAKTRKKHYIHHLVAEAFVGIRPIGMQVNHIDADKTNNHVNNLEYVTQRENSTHACRLGLSPKGERNGHAKLTVRDVMEIRDLKGHYTIRELGPLYGINHATVCDIQNRKRWKHVA